MGRTKDKWIWLQLYISCKVYKLRKKLGLVNVSQINRS